LTFAFYSPSLNSRLWRSKMTSAISAASASPLLWELRTDGLSVFYGLPETMRLFHYFIPRLILQGRRIAILDGANRFDPLLIARYARERKLEPMEFNQHIRIARAFTCFQLTELLVRLPRLLETFPADMAIVTALPDLYFDQDIREREAVASLQRALQALQTAKRLPLPIAVFTDAASSISPRRRLFKNLIAQSDYVFRFRQADAGMVLTSEKSPPAILKA
jgi:hypothetical protein